MEEQKNSEFQVRGEELLNKVKEIIREGNARRIIVKDEKGTTYFEIPLTLGVVGALFMPVLAALGAMAALVSNFTLQVIRREDEETPGT